MKISRLIIYVYIFSITFLIAGLGINLNFLYNDFYKTITQAEIVYIMQNQTSLEAIDIGLWQKIIAAIANKKVLRPINPENFKNPFINYNQPKPDEP